MERKEFKQRLKGLVVWILVLVMVVNGIWVSPANVYAEGETGITIPVNYYDSYYYTDMLMTETTPSEEGARLTSSGYTTTVTVASDASVITGVVAPTAEKEGYFFVDWGLGISGSYDAETQEVMLGDGWTAEALDDLPLVAYFQEILKSTITYNYEGGTMDGVADTTSEEVIQPAADEYEFEKAVTTSVPTMSGKIFNGWEMITLTDTQWYDEEAGIISGVYGEDCELEATWREPSILSVSYNVSADQGTVDGNTNEGFMESENPGPVEVTLPSVIPASEGILFVGWLCQEDGTSDYREDLGGFVNDYAGTGISCYPAGTTIVLEYPESVSADESSMTTYYMEPQFTMASTLKVTYDTNGGTGLESTEEIIYQSDVTETTATITLPEAPTHDTYTFAGWVCSVDDWTYKAGTTATYDFSNAEVTFTAVWIYTVPITYALDGGTITSTGYDEEVTLTPGATGVGNIILPTVTKDGYFLEDWSLELSSGIAGTYNENTNTWSWNSPSSALTELVFTANWQEALVSTITYDYAGGTLNGSTEPYVTTMTQPTIDSNSYQTASIGDIPTKEGYIFTGWALQQDETSNGSYNNGVITGHYTESYTMVAQWRAENTITITTTFATGFENAGTIDPEVAGTYGEINYDDGNGNLQITLPEVIDVKEEYLFVGWKCYDASGAAVITDAYTEIEDFDGTTISCYPAGTVLSVAYPMDTNNVGGRVAAYVLEAQFKTAATVNITFDLNGGSGDIVTNDIAYQRAIGEDDAWITMPEAPVKKGYEFLGWCMDDVRYIPGALIGVEATLDEATFVADWKENEYTIPLSYNTNDGTITSADYTEEVVLLATATSVEVILPEVEREGYLFKGWIFGDTIYDAGTQNLSWSTDLPAMDLTEITLTANWKKESVLNINYEIPAEFVDYGVINGDTGLVFYESANSGPIEITLPGVTVSSKEYFFAGWKCYDESGVEYKPNTDAYVNGKGYPAGTALTFSYVSLPDSDEGNAATYRLSAQFVAAEKIQVSYDLNGGTGLENLTDTIYQSGVNVSMGSITLPTTEPVKTGYDFIGWLSSIDNGIYAAGSAVECAFTVQSVKFSAQWEEKEYTISLVYNTDGGEITSTDYTEEITLLAMANTAEAVELPMAKKDGYFFKFWKLTNIEESEYPAGTQYLVWGEDQPAHTLNELVLKAYWQEAPKSTITYNLDGGTWDSSQTATTQEFVQPDENTTTFSKAAVEGKPVKSGYAFVGWTMNSTDASGYNAETGLITGVYGTDYVLTAVWEKVIEAGTVTLEAGVQYRLAEGSWKINGDTTIYEGGGYFYVSEDGDYTFSEK